MLRNDAAKTDWRSATAHKGRCGVVATWGSAGSGKSMLAINLAFELTRLNRKVLLVDLDMRRPSLAAWLGLTEAGPGITAALRLARARRLEIDELLRLCAELKFGGFSLDVLTGLSNPMRWTEVHPEDLSQLMSVASQHFDFILFDVNDGFSQLTSGHLTADSPAATTRWVIDSADLVLAAFIADPVGINRFLFDLSGIDREVWPIANRVSTRVFGKSSSKKLGELLSHFTSFPIRAELPSDPASCEASISSARPLMLESPNARLTLAVRSLATEILDECATRLNSDGGKT